MRKYYEGLLDHFRTLHDAARKALDLLPAEALDWVPGTEMNSVSVLIAHLCGAERYWVGDVVMGDPSFRDRQAEFRTRGISAAELRSRLSDLDAYEARALERLRVRDLDLWKVSPRDGRQVTVGWALLHALQHSALHLGHIEILTQQWIHRG